ncbi:ladderlectin-like [Branchiostoma floridae x Branchiostoma belcheri]
MNEKVSFSTARKRCKGMGANLASILEGQENSFIASIISDASCDEVWIGLQHNKWTDGSAFPYKNWAKGQPNNHWIKGGEKCVVIYTKDGHDFWMFTPKRYKGQWADKNCRENKPFICKKPK